MFLNIRIKLGEDDMRKYSSPLVTLYEFSGDNISKKNLPISNANSNSNKSQKVEQHVSPKAVTESSPRKQIESETMKRVLF